MDRIIRLINDSNKIAVLTHISEDADALGSAAAFKKAMMGIGKKTDIYISEKPEDRLSMLGDDFIVFNSNAEIINYDLCVCLDSGDLKRLGERIKIFENAAHTANIDHHFTNPNYAEENFVVGNASSTGEILYDLFIRMNIEITKEIAERLYISVASDTGCFKYSNTSPHTMRIAAELLEKGIDHADICRKLFDTEKRDVMRIKGYMMENIHEYFDGRLCIVSADEEIFKRYCVSDKDLGDLVNIPRAVEGCEIAASVRRSGEKIKMSFRSNGNYDVSGIALSFGGGGHKMAAGASIDICVIDEAEKMIVSACEKVFNSGEDLQ